MNTPAVASRSSQITPGAVRTATPFLVGWLVSVLARHGLQINDDNAAYVIGMVGGYLFYVVLRFAEVFVGAKWRYVLGLGLVGTTAAYVTPPAVVESGGDVALVKGDSGRTLLGLVGVILAVGGAVAIVLDLLGVIAVSLVLAMVVLALGVVLAAVDNSGRDFR